MTRRAALLVALIATAIALASSGAARASAPPKGPTIEVRVIHATKTEGAGSIDPQLRDLPQLTRDQPFVRYNVYKLLDRQVMPLAQGKPVALALVNGRTLQTTLLDVTQDKNERRYHVRAEIDEPSDAGKKAYLKLLEVTASANDPFFVAGQSYQGGTLFIEIVVRA